MERDPQDHVGDYTRARNKQKKERALWQGPSIGGNVKRKVSRIFRGGGIETSLASKAREVQKETRVNKSKVQTVQLHHSPAGTQQ